MTQLRVLPWRIKQLCGLKTSYKNALVFATASSILSISPFIHAQTWIDINANNDWSLDPLNLNWDGGVQFTNGSDATFGGIGEAVTITEALGINVGNLTFNADSYTIAGNDLTIGGILSVSTLGHSATLSSNITGDVTINGPGTASLSSTIGGNVTISGLGHVELINTGTTGNLNSSTTGDVIIRDNSSFTGNLTISAGTVTINNNGASFNSSGGNTASTISGGTLNIDAITSFGAGNNLSIQAGATSYTQNAAVTADISSANTNTDIGADITGTLDVTAGTTTVSENSTISGAITISGGELDIETGDTLTASSGIDVQAAGNLDSNGAITGNVTSSGTSDLGGDLTGTLDIAGGTTTVSENSTISGAITVSSGELDIETGDTLTASSGIDVQAAGNLDSNGAITGNVTSSGTSDLGGDLTGTLDIAGGTTTVSENSTISGAITVSSGELDIESGDTLTASSNIDVQASGNLDSNGSITGNVNTAGTSNLSGDITGTLDVTGGTTTIDGDSSVSGQITINGTGQLDVSAGQTLTATTGITIGSGTAGTLNAMGDIAGNVTVTSGSTYEMSGVINTGDITNDGTTTVNSDSTVVGNLVNNNTLEAGNLGAATLTLNGTDGIFTSNATLDGSTNNLTINATEFEFRPGHSSSGTVNISATTLDYGIDTNIASSVASNIVVQSGTTLTVSNSATVGASDLIDDITNEGIIDLNAGTLNGIDVLTSTSTSNQAIDIAVGTTLDANTVTSSSGKVTIAGELDADLTLTGDADLEVTSSATLDGDVTISSTSTSVVLDGTVTGTTRLNSGTVANSGNLQGRLIMTGGSLNNTLNSTGTLSRLTLNNGTINESNSMTIDHFEGSGGTLAMSAGETLTVGAANWATNFGGAITGDIDLIKVGTGNLTLSGASTYTGATTVSNGTLTINGNNANSTTTISNGATLMGSGTTGDITFSSGSFFKPGNSIGTLNTGNLTLPSGSTLEIEVDDNENGDQVSVTGTVDITDSTLAIEEISGNFTGGPYHYTIIENDGIDPIIGTFESFATNYIFITPTLNYEGGTGNDLILTLTYTITHFTEIPDLNENQLNVAFALDDLNKTPGTFGKEFFNDLYPLTDPQVKATYTDLAAEIHPSATANLFDIGSSIGDQISGRFSNLLQAGTRGNLGFTSARQNLNRNLTKYSYQASDFNPFRKTTSVMQSNDATPLQVEQPFQFWSGVSGYATKSNKDDLATGTDSQGYGIVFGVDKNIRGNTTGIAFGFNDTQIESQDKLSSLNLESYSAALYHQHLLDNDMIINGTLSYTHHNVSGARKLTNLNLTADSKYTAQQITADIEFSKPYEIDETKSVTPFILGRYSQLTTESFTETGAGGANLTSEKQDSNSFDLVLGARTQIELSSQEQLALGAGYQHRLGDIQPIAEYTFAGGGSFTTKGLERDQNSLYLEAGYERNFSEDKMFYIKTSAVASKESQAVMGNIGFKMSF